jgi:C4-dicarboxylate-specific signal transduction histidine kinase
VTWEIATHFVIWTAGLAIALLIVVFCACGVVALYEEIVERRTRTASRFERLIAEERENRKHQNHEIRKRLHELESRCDSNGVYS